MKTSAIITLQSMGSLGEPDKDARCTDVRVLSSSQHIARKASQCEHNCTISVGTTYNKVVLLEGHKFDILKHCTDISPSACLACQEARDNERQAAMAQHYDQQEQA